MGVDINGYMLIPVMEFKLVNAKVQLAHFILARPALVHDCGAVSDCHPFNIVFYSCNYGVINP